MPAVLAACCPAMGLLPEPREGTVPSPHLHTQLQVPLYPDNLSFTLIQQNLALLS